MTTIRRSSGPPEVLLAPARRGPYVFYCSICRAALNLEAPFGTPGEEIDYELIAHGWRSWDPGCRGGWIWHCQNCDLCIAASSTTLRAVASRSAGSARTGGTYRPTRVGRGPAAVGGQR